MEPTGINQLGVAHITYIRLELEFVIRLSYWMPSSGE
jgi:hypothetical protein